MLDSGTLLNIELGVSAWILLEIIGLKTKVAVISQKLNDAIEFNQLSNMTNKIKKLAVIAIIGLSVGGSLTGCGTAEKLFLTPAAPIITTNAAGVVTNAQWQPNASIAATIKAGEAVAPFVPAPFGTLAAGILALCSAGLGLYARSKSGLAILAQEHSAKINALLTTVIAGVEAANDKQTKQAIEKMSIAAENYDLLDAKVQTLSNIFPASNVLEK